MKIKQRPSNLNLRIQKLLNEIKINSKVIQNATLSKTVLWTINQSIVKLELTKLPQTKTHPITFQEKFLNIQNNFPDHHHIYTDVFKQGMKVGCAAIYQNQELLKCLPNESSISSAEVTAIELAMNITANHKSPKFIIYTDSKSVLLTLQNNNTSTPLVTKLLNKINTISQNTSIILAWIPSHIYVHRNERANKATKKKVLTDISNAKISYTDINPIINKFKPNKWQKSLDNQIHKLYQISLM